MIETLMKQLYFRGLRRRVEDLEAQHEANIPKEYYLYWFDTDDHSDPFMAIGPNGKEWYRGDPGPIPGFDVSPDGLHSEPPASIRGPQTAVTPEVSDAMET